MQRKTIAYEHFESERETVRSKFEFNLLSRRYVAFRHIYFFFPSPVKYTKQMEQIAVSINRILDFLLTKRMNALFHRILENFKLSTQSGTNVTILSEMT